MQDRPAVAIGRIRRPARALRLASDERLVALARGGDERAFEAIYERHHRALLGFCRHLLGSQAEAEDAVQHAFLAAHRELVSHDRPLHLRAWLFTIARNRCLSLLRARREHVALDDAEPSTEGLAAAVERREDVRELLGDLARLPEQQRAALLLSELGALDHEGVAAVLGCRREQVKALVFQARSSLAADREARATPCEQIRAELASARGAELRRGPLRRHLRDCAGCRAFGAEVARQRKLMAVALPVIPSVALKAAVLHGAQAAGGHAAAAHGALHGATAASAGSGTAAGGAASAGAGIAGLASSGVAKLVAVVVGAGAIAGGGALAVHAVRSVERPAAHVSSRHGGARDAAAGLPRGASSQAATAAHGRHPAQGSRAGTPRSPGSAVTTPTGASAHPATGRGRRSAGAGGAGGSGGRARAPHRNPLPARHRRPAGKPAHPDRGRAHGQAPPAGSPGKGSAGAAKPAPQPQVQRPDTATPSAGSGADASPPKPARP
jgi:RNA polymerase sigma factor (sigma-70 family)